MVSDTRAQERLILGWADSAGVKAAPRPLGAPELGANADCQLLVGPDDGYGPVCLVRVTLPSPGHTVRRCDPDSDQLVMVLAGHGQVSIEHRPTITLARNDVLHVPRAASHVIEAVDAGDFGALELLILSTPSALSRAMTLVAPALDCARDVTVNVRSSGSAEGASR
jgi:mannose-6-phosphate isomerase-like protein (cupin superfamily)